MRKTAIVCLVALSWTVTSVLAAVDIPGQNQGPTQMSPDYPELDGSDLRSGLRGAGVGMGIDGMVTGGMDPGSMDPGGMDPGGMDPGGMGGGTDEFDDAVQGELGDMGDMCSDTYDMYNKTYNSL